MNMAGDQLHSALAFSAIPFLDWVSVYGYPALIGLVFLASAGAPLPVEALLIGLGVLSADGHGPDLLPLAVLGTVAAVGGDVLDYWLGRLGSPLVRKWLVFLLHHLKKKGDLAASQTHGWRGSGETIFVTRFLLTWLGTPISILAGSTQVAFVAFLAWDVGGEAVYVVGNLALGRWASGWLAQGWFALLFWGLVAAVTALPALVTLGRWLRKQRAPDASTHAEEVAAYTVHAQAESEEATR